MTPNTWRLLTFFQPVFRPTSDKLHGIGEVERLQASSKPIAWFENGCDIHPPPKHRHGRSKRDLRSDRFGDAGSLLDVLGVYVVWRSQVPPGHYCVSSKIPPESSQQIERRRTQEVL